MRLVTCLIISIIFSLPSVLKAADLRVSATVFPVWLLVRQISDNIPNVNVGLVLPAGTGCPHDYALTPQDRKLLAQTDILVMNGLGLESFFEKGNAPLQLLKPGASVIDISKGVHDLLPDGAAATEEHLHEKTHDHPHEGSNPHIFSSPAMMSEMAVFIGRQLALLDKANAGTYQKNAEACSLRMRQLANECQAFGAVHGGVHVLAQHNIFSYMARDMDLIIDGFIQKHEGVEPSARDLLDLAKRIKSCRTSAVITEPQYPGRSGATLAAETGIPCVELDPVASGPENAPKNYYEQVMRRNIRLLEQHLGNK